jgi:serine/threonine protein kinase
MQCPQCQSSNPPGSLYCIGCGLSQAEQRKQLESRSTEQSKSNAANPSKPYPNKKRSKIAVENSPIKLAVTSKNMNPLYNFLQSGELLEGKFKLNKEIGRGGMGHVYAAKDISLGREVAVKVLPPHYNNDESVVARFQREARAMASLDHANIVTVYSIGHDAQLHYFVMKLLAGETLAHKIKRQEIGQISPYTIKEIIELLIQACNGLEHAHRKNLLHRDIKPGNLMINQDHKLTIMDFGIVKRLDNSSVETVGLKTAHGKIFGTPEYMPPEQAMGKGDYAPGSDVYALAIVAYELLCGVLPFQGDAPLEIILQHIRAAPPLFKGRAHGKYSTFERVLHKAMSKSLYDRYSNASEFRTALQGALMSEHSVNVMEIASPPRPIPPQAPTISPDLNDQASLMHNYSPMSRPVMSNNQLSSHNNQSSMVYANPTAPQSNQAQYIEGDSFFDKLKPASKAIDPSKAIPPSAPILTPTPNSIISPISNVITTPTPSVMIAPTPSSIVTPVPKPVVTPIAKLATISMPMLIDTPAMERSISTPVKTPQIEKNFQSPLTAPFTAASDVIIQKDHTSNLSHQPQAVSSTSKSNHVSFQLKMSTGSQSQSNTDTSVKEKAKSPSHTESNPSVIPASKRPGHYKGLPIRRKK